MSTHESVQTNFCYNQTFCVLTLLTFVFVWICYVVISVNCYFHVLLCVTDICLREEKTLKGQSMHH